MRIIVVLGLLISVSIQAFGECDIICAHDYKTDCDFEGDKALGDKAFKEKGLSGITGIKNAKSLDKQLEEAYLRALKKAKALDKNVNKGSFSYETKLIEGQNAWRRYVQLHCGLNSGFITKDKPQKGSIASDPCNKIEIKRRIDALNNIFSI